LRETGLIFGLWSLVLSVELTTEQKKDNKMTRRLVVAMDAGGPKAALFAHLLMTKLALELDSDISSSTSFKPDMVVGVSGGSLAAAASAFGIDISDTGGVQSACFGERRGGLFQTVFDGTKKSKCIDVTWGDVLMGDAKSDLAVLSCDIDGNARMFTSWKDGKLPVSKALDASTATPVYFPPVEINGKYYIDGGVISCNPTMSAVACALERYGEEDDIFVLSIGTKVVLDNSAKMETIDMNGCGFLEWMKSGIFTLLSRSDIDSERILLRRILGRDRYLRVVCSVDTEMDDVSGAYYMVEQEVRDVWRKFGAQISSWNSR
jgi:hypothetical protein